MSLAAQWLQPFFGAWLDSALALCLGAAVLFTALPAPAVPRLTAFTRGAVVALGVGLAAYLGVSTQAMTDSGFADIIPSLWLVLNQTDFGGMIWLAAAAWLILAIAISLPSGKHRAAPAWPTATLYLAGVLLFSVARAATGHTADKGFFSMAVLIHTIHILTAGAWVGAIAASLIFMPRWKLWTGPECSALAHRLSSMATVVVPLVALAGIGNAIRMLGHAQDPWGSEYLNLLIVKVLLVAVAIALGSWNRWFWMPHLDRGHKGGLAGFAWVLGVELVVLVAVVLIAAKLGTTMPPVPA